MPFPTGFPSRPPTSVRSLRFFAKDIASTAFADRAYLLADPIIHLKYKAQVAGFVEQEVITGQTSGAVATVFSDGNAGLTGTFILRSVTGAFQNNEQILGSVAGNATVDGVLYYDVSNPYTPLPVVPIGGYSPAPTVIPPAPYGTGVSSAYDPPAIWAQSFRICNDGALVLQFSFDGTNVHGSVQVGESLILRQRYEAGIAFRGVGGACAFRCEAW